MKSAGQFRRKAKNRIWNFKALAIFVLKMTGAFFDYIEGSIQSFEGDCASSSESNYGKRKTELDGMYLILTEKERYCMNFYMYSEDDENAQNVGIYKIEIALESEVAEDNFIWDNPPNGIFVGGQN